MIAEKDITALILCGGDATRMGGVDKPLQIIEKAGLRRPMLDHVIATLPTNSPLLISANRSIDAYAQRGTVVTDERQMGSGPLVGILAGLRSAQTDWLLVSPGDMPYLEQGWHEAIRQHAEKGTERTASNPDNQTGEQHDGLAGELGSEKNRELDSITIDDGTRLQPLLCLLRTSCADHLQAYLQAGEFSVHRWHASLPSVTVCYKNTGQFLNINTFAELQNSRV